MHSELFYSNLVSNTGKADVFEIERVEAAVITVSMVAAECDNVLCRYEHYFRLGSYILFLVIHRNISLLKLPQQ